MRSIRIQMRCSSLALLAFVAVPLLAAPTSNQKPTALFSCPPEGLCYASPRNCVDNCNAAFSMLSKNNFTVYNITMMSPLSYTAVLIKEQGASKFDKAIICSFHAPKGIVARVNYPEPIVVHQFVDTTEPEGHTDTSYTQCSTSVSSRLPAPTKAKFKLISGKWQSELVLDERLAIDVVPAVENAKVMSNSERIDIPPPDVPTVRSEDEDDEKTSESFAQKRQFEKKAKESKKIIPKEEEEAEEEEEEERPIRLEKKKPVRKDDDDSDDDDKKKDSSEEVSKKEDKGKKTSGKGSKKQGKKVEDDDEDERKEKKTGKKKKNSKEDDEEEEEEERPRYREYEDEDEDEHEHDEGEKQYARFFFFRV
ncbi:unnamed protein product [Heligmosomoides polygyrus]|uniref:Major sperm protein n=1 Tax=Heligmosomoides polygyrus TaxID=6339 RepID=A0A183FRK2_HELPZ|nr:unnamed protein product [Heligmosomoides polygyrus]